MLQQMFCVRLYIKTRDFTIQMLVGPYVLHATIATETIIVSHSSNFYYVEAFKSSILLQIGLEDDNTLHQSGMGGYCYLKNAVP